MSLTKRWMESQAEGSAASARLERARQCVQNALSAAADGRPTIGLCDIEHALNAAQHEINRLHITRAVMDGKISYWLKLKRSASNRTHAVPDGEGGRR